MPPSSQNTTSAPPPATARPSGMIWALSDWLELRVEQVLPTLEDPDTPMVHQRARALVVLSWILIPAGCVFAILYHLVLGTHVVGMAGDFLTVAIVISYATLLSSGRVRAAAHIVAFGTWIALMWGMALSGGANSPYGPFVVLMMVWIGVLHTGRDTARWGLISIITYVAFLVLGAWGVQFPNTLGVNGAHAVTMVSVPIGVAVVAGLTALARSMERRARARTDALNADLQHALQQARDAAEVKRLFLATMSHELRTPLNAVFASMEMMELQGGLDPQAQRYLDRMHRSGETLLTVINDTIDWSRLESGGLSMNAGPVNLRDVCNTVVEVLTDQAKRRRLQLLIVIDDSTPDTVFTDGARLRQVLLNLLTNALAYTTTGSVQLRLSGQAHHVSIAVQDTGPGIPADQLTNVFEPFRRLDTSSWTRARGSGLGLAICKRFTESLSGSIELVSAMGEGSTFTVRLPHDIRTACAEQPGSSL